MALEWRGPQVTKKVMEAARKGIDATTAACVGQAKETAPVETATYQGSIQMRPARRQGDRVVGYWGSYNCDYAWYIEVGTEPHEIRPKNKQALWWPGAEHPVKRVQHPGTEATNNLRNAADKEYPSLPGRIRRYMEAG